MQGFSECFISSYETDKKCISFVSNTVTIRYHADIQLPEKKGNTF
jgi:hypothetical protein